MSAQHNLSCRYREFWLALASTRSAEHTSDVNPGINNVTKSQLKSNTLDMAYLLRFERKKYLFNKEEPNYEDLSVLFFQNISSRNC